MKTINKSIQIWDAPYVRIAFIVSILVLTVFSTSISIAEAPPPTTIGISGKVSGSSGTVALEATAKGTTSSLVGRGAGVHINFASEARFTLTGSISGSVVTLTGAVTQSGFAALIGTPVSIVADASTGTITHIFGPIAGGPLAGVTLTFTGTGTVVIN